MCIKVVTASRSNNSNIFKDCFQKVSKAGLNPLLWYGTLHVAKQAWNDLPAEFNAAWRHRAQRTKEIGIRGKSLKVWLQLLLTACSINRCRALKTKGLPRILFIHKFELCFMNIKKITVRSYLISYKYLPSWRNVPSSSIFIGLARRRSCGESDCRSHHSVNTKMCNAHLPTSRNVNRQSFAT